jgi:hypothetical protein
MMYIERARRLTSTLGFVKGAEKSEIPPRKMRARIVSIVVSRMGSKKTTLAIAFLLGVSTMMRFSIPNMIFAVSMSFLTCFFAGCFNTANQSLNLDQMPSLRGSMMFLTAALGSVRTTGILGLSGVLLTQFARAVSYLSYIPKNCLVFSINLNTVPSSLSPILPDKPLIQDSLKAAAHEIFQYYTYVNIIFS